MSGLVFFLSGLSGLSGLALMAPLTLQEAVDRALATDPSLDDAAAQRSAAEATLSGIRANYGPKLRLDGNVIVWDEEQTISFAAGGDTSAAAALPPPATPYEFAVQGIIQGLSALGTPTKVRDQVTTQATVQVIQPLVGLYGVSQGAEAAALGVDVAEVQAVVSRHKIEKTIVEAYFRALQARAFEKAAAQSVESLQTQLKRVESLHANGILGKNDVLRVGVALAAARQKLNVAQAQVAQSQSALAVFTGAPSGSTFELDETPPPFAAEPVPTLDEAREAALRDRPEILQVQTLSRQASEGVDATRTKLLPDLNLIGQYQYNHGSTFQAENSLFAGLMFSWMAWEWGATSRQIDVAESQKLRADAMLGQLHNGVKLEVEAAHVSYRSADGMIAVAEEAAGQAEEALRLEKARLEAQQSTTADVVNAETALMEARMNLESARYQRLIARAHLRHAMGQAVLTRPGRIDRGWPGEQK